MTAADIVTQGTAVAAFSNVLVNAIRISFPRIQAVPLVALAAAIAVAFLMATAQGIGFDRAAIAFTILVGISGGGGAMLIAMAQGKGDEKAEAAAVPVLKDIMVDVRKDNQPL